MLRKLLSTVFALGILTGLSPAYSDTPPPSFTHVVFFGDSLSDNGNLYNHTNHAMPKYPPYFKGRFSDGYNWADLVSYNLFSHYHVTTENYAVGGATAVFHNPFRGFLPVTLSMERADYNLRTLFTDKSNTLYSIWVGANDYLPGDTDVDGATTAVVQSIVDTITALSSNKNASFFIVDMPDLSLTPQATLMNLADNYKALAIMHNMKLHAAIVQLRAKYPTIKITEFNFTEYPILDEMINSEAFRDQINQKYGVTISNVTDPCWEGGFTHPSPAVIKQTLLAQAGKKGVGAGIDADALSKYISRSPGLLEAYRVSQRAAENPQECTHPEQYLFWDHLHPTAATHKVLAGIFMDTILNGQ